ncbi:XRE family transcriptional regulator [Hymenobacter metallicola]|uniref:LexA family transcriptional regulator n=1 Tax=Hymenobacter metallicola TaxID=2563114 RepID=A0A4Z0QKH8_9BACT|nr:LexA family transcriptional regulator [Hymenobacter metallicola]TGE29753.1 LexA family transcriptional regulator [Hymenobacter metallicola]
MPTTPSTINMLIQRILEERKLRNNKFAAMLGVDKSTVTRWVEGKSFPKRDMREKIAQVFDYPLEQLLLPDELAMLHGGDVPLVENNVKIVPDEYPRAFALDLPYIPIVARAGFAEMASSNVIKSLASLDTFKLTLANDPGNKYANSAIFEVNGDSMEKTLPHGSKVVADLIAEAKWHSIYERVVIICFGEYLVIKRIHGNDLSTQGFLMLHSDSETPMSPYPVPRNQIRSMWLVQEFAERAPIR